MWEEDKQEWFCQKQIREEKEGNTRIVRGYPREESLQLGESWSSRTEKNRGKRKEEVKKLERKTDMDQKKREAEEKQNRKEGSE